MATTLTPIKTTPFSLTCTLTGDNGVLSSYAWATLDGWFNTPGPFKSGPLRSLLKQLFAAGKLATLDLNGANSGKVRIRNTEAIGSAQAAPISRTITWTAAGLEVTAAAGSTSELEIRFEHSVER
jgi:hypothetical protein